MKPPPTPSKAATKPTTAPAITRMGSRSSTGVPLSQSRQLGTCAERSCTVLSKARRCQVIPSTKDTWTSPASNDPVNDYIPHDAQFPELHVEQPLPPPRKPESPEPEQLKDENRRRGPRVPHEGHSRSVPSFPNDWRTSKRLPHFSHSYSYSGIEDTSTVSTGPRVTQTDVRSPHPPHIGLNCSTLPKGVRMASAAPWASGIHTP